MKQNTQKWRSITIRKLKLTKVYNMVQWPCFDVRPCRRWNSLQRPVNHQSADPFWTRNSETFYKIKMLLARYRLRSEPSWHRVKLWRAAATCRAGERKCPHLLWSGSYLAARQVPKCQQYTWIDTAVRGLTSGTDIRSPHYQKWQLPSFFCASLSP